MRVVEAREMKVGSGAVSSLSLRPHLACTSIRSLLCGSLPQKGHLPRYNLLPVAAAHGHARLDWRRRLLRRRWSSNEHTNRSTGGSESRECFFKAMSCSTETVREAGREALAGKFEDEGRASVDK